MGGRIRDFEAMPAARCYCGLIWEIDRDEMRGGDRENLILTCPACGTSSSETKTFRVLIKREQP
jgi:hypothetical protein